MEELDEFHFGNISRQQKLEPADIKTTKHIFYKGGLSQGKKRIRIRARITLKVEFKRQNDVLHFTPNKGAQLDRSTQAYFGYEPDFIN